MNIFQEVKSYVTAKQAAEQYGIRVGRNRMACCPFHDDHHPSMKLILIIAVLPAEQKGM